jgi:hypothetical protein
MKKLALFVLFLCFIAAGFGQFQPQFAAKDSAVLRKNPYFFKDPKRPYNKDPRTWTNYPTNIKTPEQAAAEIEKAKKENDFYRMFQIGTLGLFKEEKDRVNAIYAPELQAYLYQDPWMLLNVTNYLIEHPVTGYNDMKTSFVAEETYKAAISQKDAEALYAIAELQKNTSIINNVSVATILENAKKFEQIPAIAAEPKKSNPVKKTPYVPKVGAKHMGKLISGNITNGKGTKQYIKKDSLVGVGWKYEGTFKNGYESGQGLLYDAANKLIYDGNWENGLFNGEGALTYPMEKYKGGFLNGKKHGKGSYENFEDSTKYTGDYVNDEATGFGTYTTKKGFKYIGEFKKDKFEGKGKFYMDGKSLTFEGTFKNSIWDGPGVYYLENGTMEGNFSGDAINGAYILTKKDGSKYNVTCKNNDIVTSTLISGPKNSVNIKSILESVWTGKSQSRSDLMKSGYVICEEKMYNIYFNESTNTFTGISLSTFTLEGKKYEFKCNIRGTYNPNNNKVEIRITGKIFADPLPNSLYWSTNIITNLELGKNANGNGSYLMQGKTSNQSYSDEFISFSNR